MIKKLWYGFFWFLIRNVYFRKIIFTGDKNIITDKPSLFLSLHKNGAVDGWPLLSVLPPSEFMIAAQLRKNFIARLFFYGIPVIRNQDKGDKRINVRAIEKCIENFKENKNLLIFPEGTSTLGPKHLEFKKGAAKLAARYAKENGRTLSVIPMGIYYDSPSKMGGKVEITAGKKIDISSNDAEIIHRNITLALEKEGVNTENADEYKYMRQFAVAASLYEEVYYGSAMKAAEKNPEILNGIKEYEAKTQKLGLIKYKNVAVFPENIFKSFVAFLMTTPFVLTAFGFNIIAVSIGFVCGKKLPDDENVITFWKIISGFSAGLVWMVFVLAFLKIYGILLLLISFLGFKVYGVWKKHAVSLLNFFKSRKTSLEFANVRKDAVRLVNIYVSEVK